MKRLAARLVIALIIITLACLPVNPTLTVAWDPEPNRWEGTQMVMENDSNKSS
jgi:hypothetical protein